MAKKKETKRQKHDLPIIRINSRSSNTNPTKNRGWSRVSRSCKQILVCICVRCPYPTYMSTYWLLAHIWTYLYMMLHHIYHHKISSTPFIKVFYLHILVHCTYTIYFNSRIWMVILSSTYRPVSPYNLTYRCIAIVTSDLSHLIGVYTCQLHE